MDSMQGLFYVFMDKQIIELYKVFKQHPRVCTDSRKIEVGSIFFALKGPSFNGNKYAQEALNKGAAYAVVDEMEYLLDDKSLLVENTLKCLQQLSTYHRTQLNIPIIGITGSNGKTTSKELIKSILASKYKVSATEGNLNNHIGVPLSLLKVKSSDDLAIIEMGSNGKGEIAFLCSICQPSHALITSIGKAHLEGFGDLDGVIVEKTALYRSVENCCGTIFYNDDSYILKNHLPEITQNIPYSKKGSHAFEIIARSSFPSITGSCKRGNNTYEFISSMYGEYNVANISSALTIGDFFDVDLLDALKAVKDYKPSNNRSEAKIYKGANIYLDAYNANPSSVALVIDQFAKSEGSKILILGDMLEVGKLEDQEHGAILSSIDPNNFSKVILFGALFSKHKNLYPSFDFYKSFDVLKSSFQQLEIEKKNILLKGSRGMGLERLLTD